MFVGRRDPLDSQSRGAIRVVIQDSLAGTTQGFPVTIGDLLDVSEPPQGLRGEDAIRVRVRYSFQEVDSLFESTPPEPHQSLPQIQEGQEGFRWNQAGPIQQGMSIGIEKEEGRGPERPVAPRGITVLAKIELKRNEPFRENPEDLLVGKRFGFQPSAFRSGILREVKEDGFSFSPAPFKGMVQVARPFNPHHSPLFRQTEDPLNL